MIKVDFLNYRALFLGVLYIFCCMSFPITVLAEEIINLQQQINDLQSRVGVLEKEVARLKEKQIMGVPAPSVESNSELDCEHPGLKNIDIQKNKVSITKSEITNFRENIPEMLSAARVLSYFQNRRSRGIRIFSIRPGSIYEKIGIKNGDIIISVDNVGTCNPESLYLLPFFQNPPPKNSKIILDRSKNPVEIEVLVK